MILEQAGDMGRIAGSGNGDDRARIGDAMRGCKRRRPAKTVADQDCWSAAGRTQVIGGGDQVIHVR